MVRDLAVDKVARVMGVGKIIKVITEALTLTLVQPESGNCAIYLRLQGQIALFLTACVINEVAMAVTGIAINKPVKPSKEPKTIIEKITASG